MQPTEELLARCAGNRVTRRRGESARDYLARVTHVKIEKRGIVALVLEAPASGCHLSH